MLKASLQEMMPVYLKFFNSIPNSGTIPQTWCGGLIIPIYKLEIFLSCLKLDSLNMSTLTIIYTLQFSDWFLT